MKIALSLFWRWLYVQANSATADAAGGMSLALNVTHVERALQYAQEL